MKKQILQILTSAAFGFCIYFGYKNLITGMNPMLMSLFGFFFLLLFILNLILIKQIKKKTYSLVLFFILGFVIPLILIVKQNNQINGDPIGRKYFQKNNVR
jgi:hypothetical protein